MFKLALAVLAAIVLLSPAAVRAQPFPSYAEPPPGFGEENIHGRIVSFDGHYALRVRDERGFIDNVRLHQGTIINPTGITLEPGMVVSILGYNAGSYLEANEIDTPYTYVAGVPYWSGHPWSYYGPGVSLGFFFGSPGWWHGTFFHGSFHFSGGARVYAVPFRTVYVGGGFQGRAYVAAPQHGGYVMRASSAPHASGGHSEQSAHESHGGGGHGDGGDHGGGGGHGGGDHGGGGGHGH